jgi:hypothetical protein
MNFIRDWYIARHWREMFGAATALTALLFASIAFGAETATRCSQWQGRVASVVTFDSAVEKFRSIGPKGEFETTAEYEARRSRVIGASGTPVVILNRSEDPKFFEYDADTATLRVVRYAFSNRGMDYWSAFYTANQKDKFDVSTGFNLAFVASMSEVPVGTYQASNAYGAKAEITRLERTVKAVFERGAKLDEALFPNTERPPFVVGTIKMKPDEARRIKPGLKTGFLVKPKAPFLISGRHRVGTTTIQNPYEVTESFQILIADIQCGFLLDSDNKVLGAYPTR